MSDETKAGGHTPGPWEVRKSPDGNYLNEVVAKTKRGMWKAVARVGGFFRNDREVNARLIAAAPELLEALEEAEFLQRENYGDGMALHIAMIGWSDKARAAIRKAKGETE